jgi:uncharacterized protein YlxW (UPF0749 family)
MLGFLSNPLIAAICGVSFVAGLTAMFLVWAITAPFHDAAVRREAQKAYVAISVLEAEKARADTARKLLEAERKRAADLAADRERIAAALQAAISEIDAATAANEGLQDEIDKLAAARPAGVPTVRDLGVRLRN